MPEAQIHSLRTYRELKGEPVKFWHRFDPAPAEPIPFRPDLGEGERRYSVRHRQTPVEEIESRARSAGAELDRDARAQEKGE